MQKPVSGFQCKERQGEGYDRKYCDSGTDRSILYLSDLQRL